ncbi:ABC transporter [Ochrobactrum pecoris]|uniref:ABC transporter n=2 Tax=Brucella pecoris TaxID=867683 RepID=A0A5C5CJ42_9HYPH|nr:ABC-type transport auxiliary lipoprotein family protein [Brucella pecoris]MBB4094746.1 cholesterol transport system auxiliary component [Brucella pecoris]NKW80223.1 ABC transporter [Brucella pecoris]TNV11310.1 ABC transporter [Brucella pecoris]
MISKAGSSDMKSRRIFRHKGSISILLAALLAGCGTTTPLDTFNLSAPQPGVTAPSRKNTQLLVPTPTALKALDSENIVVSSAPGSIEYLKGAQWGDRLTNIVQSRLVQAYENTGVFGGIGRPGDGLAINYQILTDVRMFGIQAYASPKLAVVELAVRLMNDKSGEVRATRVFRTAVPVSGTTNAAYVKALNAAFERTASEIVSWTVTAL